MKLEKFGMRYVPRIEPLFTPAGWVALGAIALVALVVLPLLFLLPAPESVLHVSAYTITLAGKIMCYCIVAMAMNLIWGYTGYSLGTACSSRSVVTPSACT